MGTGRITDGFTKGHMQEHHRAKAHLVFWLTIIGLNLWIIYGRRQKDLENIRNADAMREFEERANRPMPQGKTVSNFPVIQAITGSVDIQITHFPAIGVKDPVLDGDEK